MVCRENDEIEQARIFRVMREARGGAHRHGECSLRRK
jgi:hypothetical protein